jgi:hypothetical protein
MTENANAGPEQPTASPTNHAVAQIAYGALAIGVVITVVAIARHFSGALATIDLATVLDRHGPAVVGIPTAGVVAFFLVVLARALDGPMALDLFGLKSQGASAICVVWIAVFLAISVSFRALW